MIRAVEQIALNYPSEHVRIETIADYWDLCAVGARYGKVYFTENTDVELYLVSETAVVPSHYVLVDTFKKFPMLLYKKTALEQRTVYSISNLLNKDLLRFLFAFHELFHDKVTHSHIAEPSIIVEVLHGNSFSEI